MSTNIPTTPTQPLAPYDSEAVAARILDNDELVMRILESEHELSAPMRIEEFMDWIKTMRPQEDRRAGAGWESNRISRS